MRAARPIDPVQFQLDALRTELADLAYDLDRRGQPDAADVAMTLRARLGEIAAGRSDAGSPVEANLVSLSFPT